MLKRKKNKKTIKKTLAWLGIASMLLLQAFASWDFWHQE